MKGLGSQFGLLLLATLVTGVCSALGFAVLHPSGQLPAVVTGVLLALPAGLIGLMAAHRWGTSVNVILASTLLRPALTLGLGCAFAALSPGLWSMEFFVSLGLAYLAGLGVETWAVMNQMRQAGGASRPA